MSVRDTRSLDYLFIFKESEKRLTMDSLILFHKVSSLSPKKYRKQLRRTLLARRLEYTFSVSSLSQSENIFNFKEFEKILTMDSIR
jgi:hypothetical protein